MADLQTTTWSETAASNNAATPDGWPENQSYASVNDCAREMMGSIKREWNRSHPTLTAGGTANALTLTYTTAPPAYVRGLTFRFISGASANTGAATINVNGLGAAAIVRGDDSSALIGGEIPASAMCEVVHDGTNFRLTMPIFNLIGTRWLASVAPSGTPTYLEFSLPSGFDSFVFDVANVCPTANAQLAFQLSLDGGSSWLTNSTDYTSGAVYNIAPGYVANTTFGSALLSVTVRNDAACRARVELSPTIAGSTGSYYTSTGSGVESSGGVFSLWTYGGASVQTATRPNRIRFLFVGTTFKNFGKITLMGVRP